MATGEVFSKKKRFQCSKCLFSLQAWCCSSCVLACRCWPPPTPAPSRTATLDAAVMWKVLACSTASAWPGWTVMGWDPPPLCPSPSHWTLPIWTCPPIPWGHSATPCWLVRATPPWLAWTSAATLSQRLVQALKPSFSMKWWIFFLIYNIQTDRFVPSEMVETKTELTSVCFCSFCSLWCYPTGHFNSCFLDKPAMKFPKEEDESFKIKETRKKTIIICLILCFYFTAFLSCNSPHSKCPIFLFVNLLPAFSLSDKLQCFVQAALPGDAGPEPQQPGEPVPKLFLRPPSDWSWPQPQQLPGVRHGCFCH